MTSVPLVSASLLNLKPIVALMRLNAIYATTKTNMFTDNTPINWVLKFAPEFVAGTINVPQIPANK